jgi:hypothetical protein
MTSQNLAGETVQGKMYALAQRMVVGRSEPRIDSLSSNAGKLPSIHERKRQHSDLILGALPTLASLD